ncbi:CAP domain-containing protein [Natranaerofaba carboxydovora]|uniref:CAP domain-containing protein n=1 Tax=Natranaerofaba carboxydovora TaxID=2742683 RepID=UPI001F147B8B|nr:CAP domain-containing protein [Natranaerofaba carboxydovora]UMZ75258.1 Cysteine-rich secretory protein family protein [Natranaerofaba carboxydovora]
MENKYIKFLSLAVVFLFFLTSTSQAFASNRIILRSSGQDNTPRVIKVSLNHSGWGNESRNSFNRQVGRLETPLKFVIRDGQLRLVQRPDLNQEDKADKEVDVPEEDSKEEPGKDKPEEPKEEEPKEEEPKEEEPKEEEPKEEEPKEEEPKEEEPDKEPEEDKSEENKEQKEEQKEKDEREEQEEQEELNDAEEQMINKVNEERRQRGLSPLEVDYEVVEVARAKSQDMIDNNYFAHNSPTYGSPFDMLNKFGINYRTAGENLAGSRTVETAHNNLMNSDGHRRNILNENFTHIGVGVVEGGTYGKYFTQMFIGK